MEIVRVFKEHRKLIGRSLKVFFERKERELAGVNRWGRDLVGRLLKFSLQGKMIRGGLVILAYKMFETPDRASPQTEGRLLHPPPGWVTDVAAAYELIHSSLLIHDDIMDRDRLRRGEPTIFRQYEELGEREGLAEPDHFGESLGICAGDIGFFLAFEMLSGLDAQPPYSKPDLVQRISHLWAKELTPVGLAQMEDVAFGTSQKEPEEGEVLILYRYKTARYTFSLPLATGAIAAGAAEETVGSLEELGENLGILFQMKDDELGLYGTEEETGKPPGSDIKEGKKTLLALTLAKRSGREYREIVARLRDRFREDEPITYEGLEPLRELAVRSGAAEALDTKRKTMRDRAEELIGSLGVDDGAKTLLWELLRYNLERTR